MGSVSYIHGQLDIQPDLAPRRVTFRDEGLLRGRYADRDVEVTVDGDTEIVQVSRLIGVEPDSEDAVKVYHLRQELDEIVGQIPDGHSIGGVLIREGEEQGDVERFVVDGLNIRSETARLVWPDGSDVTW